MIREARDSVEAALPAAAGASIDQLAVDELIDRLAASCDTAQVGQFRAAFEHWHRIQHRRVPAHAYQHARRALEQWQDYINRLPEVTS